jgi:hypothetical protein
MQARWIETRRGELAILLQVHWDAGVVQLRWADAEGGYSWRRIVDIRRRRDFDGHDDPWWLARARKHPSPNALRKDAWWLLDLVPAPPDDLPEPDLQKDWYEQPRLSHRPGRETDRSHGRPARPGAEHRRQGRDA